MSAGRSGLTSCTRVLTTPRDGTMDSNKGAIIRLVDEYLKRHGLTEPRGSGPTAMVKAESYRALRDGLIRSGARMPLDDFRATLKVVVEKAMQRGY